MAKRKFRVRVSRKSTHYGEVEVETTAEDFDEAQDEAWEKALELAKEDQVVEWDTKYYEIDDDSEECVEVLDD